MSRSRQVTAALLGIAVFISLSTVGIFVQQFLSKRHDERLREDVLSTIVKDRPVLATKGRSLVEITSVVNIGGGWQLAYIKSVNDQSISPVPVKLLLQTDKQGDLQTALGPGVRFDDTELQTLGLSKGNIDRIRNL